MVAPLWPFPLWQTHKGCQLEPNFASLLGLVPPIFYQVYATNGRGMCAQRATFILHKMVEFSQVGEHTTMYASLTPSQHFVHCIQCKGRVPHSPCMSRRSGCRQRSFCSLKMPTSRTTKCEYGEPDFLASASNRSRKYTRSIVWGNEAQRGPLGKASKKGGLTYSNLGSEYSGL